MKCIISVCFLISLGSLSHVSYATDFALTAQSEAFAPNAGGQTSYALRLSVDDRVEYSGFSNQYLTTGNIPLSGVIYSRRVSRCAIFCAFKVFGQLGAGASTAGPVIESILSLNLFWITRIDFTTHFYGQKNRFVTWSYPLWLGVQIPF